MNRDIDATARGIAQIMTGEGADKEKVYKLGLELYLVVGQRIQNRER
jgi:hypothetical protein